MFLSLSDSSSTPHTDPRYLCWPAISWLASPKSTKRLFSIFFPRKKKLVSYLSKEMWSLFLFDLVFFPSMVGKMKWHGCEGSTRALGFSPWWPSSLTTSSCTARKTRLILIFLLYCFEPVGS